MARVVQAHHATAVAQVKYIMPYTKSFKFYQGGKQTNPDELTLVSDSGERAQPTQRQFEG
jgi:hypothetical protein